MHSGIQATGLQQLPHPATTRKKLQVSKPPQSFQDVFHKQLEAEGDIKVSKHAEKRLHSREVKISAAEWKHISERVSEAKTKGITDTIVLTDQAALVVSAENHTVVTAMSRKEAASHVFTNINGAIII